MTSEEVRQALLEAIVRIAQKQNTTGGEALHSLAQAWAIVQDPKEPATPQIH